MPLTEAFEGSSEASMSAVFNPTTRRYHNLRADLNTNTDFYNYILNTSTDLDFLKSSIYTLHNSIYLMLCHAEVNLDTSLLSSVIELKDQYINKHISIILPCFKSLNNFLPDSLKSVLPNTSHITTTIAGSLTSLSPLLCVFYFSEKKEKIKSIFGDSPEDISCFKILKVYNSAAQPALIQFYSTCKDQTEHSNKNSVNSIKCSTSNNSRFREFNFENIVNPSIIIKQDKKALLTCAAFEMFNYFNFLWNSNKKKFYVKTINNTVFTCHNKLYGILEYIERTITIKELTPSTTFNQSKSKTSNFEEEETFTFDRFYFSSIGSLIACFVLGIRDRHYENILFNDKFEMVQIDFEFMFGEQANPDTGPFPITNKFKKKLGSKWPNFVEGAVEAFIVCRENRVKIEKIAEVVFGKTVDRRKLFKHFKNIWKAEYTEIKMKEKIRKMVNEAPYLRKTKIKNKIHQISNSFR